MFPVSAIICFAAGPQWGWDQIPMAQLEDYPAALHLQCDDCAAGLIQWRSGDRATVPPRIINNRSIAGAVWLTFCLTGCMYVTARYVPMWFQVVQDTTAYQAGINFSPPRLRWWVASPASGFPE